MLSRRTVLHLLGACLVTPLGAAARRPFRLYQLGTDIWLHESWQKYDTGYAPSNGLFMAGRGEALLIDTACTAGDTARLLERVARIAGASPVRLLVTHAHDDRMAGLHLAHDYGMPSLAHELTVQRAVANGLGQITESWSGEERILSVGGRRVDLFYPGPAHAPDNIVAWLPNDRLLFGGCMIREATAVDLAGVEQQDLCHWPEALRRVIARYGAARLVVPGHGAPGDAAILHHTLRLARAGAAISCG